MKILMILLSGVILVNNHSIDKTQLETITGTKVVQQGIVPVVAKKNTSTKKISSKKSKTNKKNVKKSQKTKKYKSKKKKKTTKKKVYKVQNNVSEIKQYAHSLVLSYGWNENDWNAFVQIINHESGWRVTAENPKSHAYGLCQSLPGKKMASAGSDWRTNYKTQLKWCMSYIKGRYGSPTSAWKFWQKHHWF